VNLSSSQSALGSSAPGQQQMHPLLVLEAALKELLLAVDLASQLLTHLANAEPSAADSAAVATVENMSLQFVAALENVRARLRRLIPFVLEGVTYTNHSYPYRRELDLALMRTVLLQQQLARIRQSFNAAPGSDSSTG